MACGLEVLISCGLGSPWLPSCSQHFCMFSTREVIVNSVLQEFVIPNYNMQYLTTQAGALTSFPFLDCQVKTVATAIWCE